MVWPSTVGIGRSDFKSTPMMLRIVLMTETPWAPAERAERDGSSMRVTFGVIFAQTGFVAAAITQPVTSSTRSGFSPIAAPIFRSGRPCGQEKLSSNPSTPVSSQRPTTSAHASRECSSMIEAISGRSG